MPELQGKELVEVISGVKKAVEATRDRKDINIDIEKLG
jgi:phosphohistidine swiveling domain-containing protein